MPGRARHQPVEPRRKARLQAPSRSGRGVNEIAGRGSTTRDDPPMIVCARYDVLRALADSAGVEHIT
ncbi:MAG: hypothetical protein U0236_10175 [Nitrospira sp.]